MTEAEELELLELEHEEAAARSQKPQTTLAPMSKTEAALHGAVEAIPFGQKLVAMGAHAVPEAMQYYGQKFPSITPSWWQNIKNTPSVDQQLLKEREKLSQAEKENPWSTSGGKLLGGGLSMALMSPIKAAQGAGAFGRIGATAANAGLYGAAHGVGQSDSIPEAVGKAAIEGGSSAILGGLGGAMAEGVGSLGRMAAGKSQSIRDSVIERAAKEAAAETGSAKSAAGHAAQDAYKQLEHLRELGRLGMLSPEGETAAANLAQELGGKAEEKLLPAIAKKETTAAAFKDSIASEPERAKKIAEDALGASEMWRQIGARAKRYGLPAIVGAAAGGHSGSLFNLGAGAVIGASLRPMMHSLLRMSKNPAFATRALDLASGLGGIAAPSIESGGVPALIQGAQSPLERLLMEMRLHHQMAKQSDENPKLAIGGAQ